ncbi:hypothetical protein [Bdellovibrio sp. GT3]|uniref:hypothetical protein n=1 Tax=Bdellovibrio sp. GT3 TaxID=3136282 RepID=UPI0030F233DF
MKSTILVLIMLLLSPLAFAGPRYVGNGGDTYSLQFQVYAEKLNKYLQNSNIEGLNVILLRDAISSTKVESTNQKLILNGIPKDAINYPAEKRIIFNSNRWIGFTEDEKLSLVLHEYLGLIGLEDAKYTYSKLILKDMTTVQRIRQGGDSMWQICQDDTLVVNLYEHRAEVEATPTGAIQHRTTNITMIYGGWVLIGELRDASTGNVTLRHTNGSYSGMVSIISNGRLTLTGTLKLAGYEEQLNMTMLCAEKYRR